jgi:hypothetical protein
MKNEMGQETAEGAWESDLECEHPSPRPSPLPKFGLPQGARVVERLLAILSYRQSEQCSGVVKNGRGQGMLLTVAGRTGTMRQFTETFKPRLASLSGVTS